LGRYVSSVIVSMHVASGAAAGALLGTRARALVAGPLLHLAADVIPHQDIESRRFEIRSGLALVALVAARYGPTHPAVVGALAASAPDIEHVWPLPRPGGRKLFPTHRWTRLHRSGGVSASGQLLAAGVIAGLVVSAHKR
jgi:hypothetical protein